MELGISTASFYSRLQTEDALPAIRRLGADVCEIFLDSYSEYEPDFGALLLERVQDFGLKVVSVHAMSQQFEPQLFSLSLRQRNDALRLFEKVLRQGRLLGASRLVFHGPARLRGALRNAAFMRIGPIVSDLADMAGEYGLRLAWENVSWCLFSYPDFVSEIMEYIKTTNLGFTLDIKQAVRSGHDPFAYVAAMGGMLCHVHLCDYDLSKPDYGLCLPGRGTFDFRKLFATLESSGYTGAAMIEPYSDLYLEISELGESLSAMTKLLPNG
ncbi:MAG: sugar phosphate isomerase/epimerase family protein [Christensenellales bacterium]|jgi:sugar phosphate isomerase/epimerase